MMTRVLNVVSYLAFAASVGMSVWFYDVLPRVIPIHFNLYGAPDGWAPKSWLWLLPAVHLFSLVMVTAAEHFKALSRKPWFTDEQAERSFAVNKRWLPRLKCVMSLLFAYLQGSIIATAFGAAAGLNPWVMGGFIAAILVTAGVMACQQLRR